MNEKNVVIDPIHGKIEMPQWLVRIKDEPSVRRMMNIKQLGLKAFIDFPGAIHTRYLHSLGTMFLAGKLVDLLIEKEGFRKSSRKGLVENLKNNRNSLLAAGLFHDIGHGPFSHVMDFVFEEIGLSHEQITTEIITHFKQELEGDSIPVSQVNKMITKKHRYPFLWQIISGPLDVDKLDYILRDSYYVGLKYGFDLDHFFDQIAILGDADELEMCELGLKKDRKARVCTELFLLLWKSMYDLVYFAQSSRIAEKMLEKAILYAVRNEHEMRDHITNLSKYLDLDEAKLMEILHNSHGFPKEIVDKLKTASLYIPVFSQELQVFEANPKFLRNLQIGEDRVSDKLSHRLSMLGSKPYSVICDIVKERTPKAIHLEEKDKNGQPYELKQKSGIVRALSRQRIFVNVYVHPTLSGHKTFFRKKNIKSEIQKAIDGW